MFEFFSAFLVGGKVVVIDKILDLVDGINNLDVSLINCVPSAIKVLTQHNKIPSSVETVNLAGEPLRRSVIDDIYASSKVGAVYNLYGPSEDTTYSTYVRIDKGDAREPSIGRALDNTQLHVLDSALNPVPIGVEGQLYIGGSSLSRGYHNRPQLTSEKFISNPFSREPGARLYQTGDLVRWCSNGELIFVGRIDHQIKLRGFRIELGEIETALMKHNQVREALVMLDESLNEPRLVAYALMKQITTDTTAIRNSLKQRLPEYMLPSAIVSLIEWPLSANGKINREALPAPVYESTGNYEAPRNKLETQLCEIWQAVLGLSQVGIEDNFFAIGGDSIQAIQVVSRARREGLQISARDLFDAQEISLLALKVKRNDLETDILPAEGKQILNPIMHGFFADRGALNHYNQSMIMSFPKGINQQQLQQALQKLVERHDVFRLRFFKENETWCAKYLAFSEFDINKLICISEIDYVSADHNSLAEKITIHAQSIQQSLDISQGPLLQIVRYKTSEREQDRLLWVVHHLLIDGVSWRIIKDDLTQLLNQIMSDETLMLANCTSRYQTWVKGLYDYSQTKKCQNEVDYWVQQLALPILSLPINNYPKGTDNTQYSTAKVTLAFDEDLTDKLLNKANSTYHTQINDLLLTALSLAVKDWCTDFKNEKFVSLDLEGHGREDEISGFDSTETVGWFTSLFPVRLNVDYSSGASDFSPGDCIKAVKETLRSIPDKGIGFGILRDFTENKKLHELAQYSELLFNYLGQYDSNTSELQQSPDQLIDWLSDDRGSDISAGRSRTHKLSINGQVFKGCLGFVFDYNEHYFSNKSVSIFSDKFKYWLTQVVNHCVSSEESFTPSDFPLAKISVSYLDRLQQDYNICAVYPSTDMQQGLLLETELSEDGNAYITQIQFSFENIDSRVLKQSWEKVLARHDILRTAFVVNDDAELLQVVQQEVELPWREENCDHMESQEIQVWLKVQRVAECREFDNKSAPLMRLSLSCHNNLHYLIWTHHHALLDGWSLQLVLKEVTQIYNSLVNLVEFKLPRATSYLNYINWLAQQDYDAAEVYWRDYLSECQAMPLPVASLKSLDRVASINNQETDCTAEITCNLTRAVTENLEQLARNSHVTLNIVLQAAWGLLLSRYTNSSEAVFGVTHSGRSADLNNSENIVGLFINTQPLRMPIPDDDTSLQAWLKQLHKKQLLQLEHGFASLKDINNWLGYNSSEPLFEALMVFENMPIASVSDENKLSVLAIETKEQVHYPLTLTVLPENKLKCNIIYLKSRVDTHSAELLSQNLMQLLNSMADASGIADKQTVTNLKVITDKEQKQLDNWNNTKVSFESNLCIHQHFEKQVKLHPDKTAVYLADEKLSYQQLDDAANKVAHILLEKGIKADSLVGICLERSLEMVVSLIAILKAGGSYVPLDPEYPSERLQFILKDSDVSLVLTTQKLLPILPLSGQLILCMDSDELKNKCANENNNNAINASPSIPQQLAYVNYTSGTTGQPKGVLLTHMGVTRLVKNNKYVSLNSSSRILQLASLNFDAATFEIWGALLNGGELVLYPDKNPSVEKLQEVIEQYSITTVLLSSAFFEIISEFTNNVGKSLRYLLVGGDVVSPRAAKKIYQELPELSIINCYGPTENTTISSSFTIPRDWPEDQPLPIGRPISNSTVYVLNTQQQLQPIGAIGELYVGGDGLARGYINRDSLTQECFLDCPGELYERVYKTGDLVRWLADGQLAFIGRVDNQVKIRGFRVEPGEIEAALTSQVEVKEARVVIREEQGDKRILAYVLTQTEIDTKPLRDALKQLLPPYMQPSAITCLTQWPLTLNGKIDNQALPQPNYQADDEYVAPRTEVEKQLCKIWQAVLRLEHIGINEHFFSIGGDSIQAIQVVSRARREGIFFNTRDLFDAPEISLLALRVERKDISVKVLPAEGKQVLMPIMHHFFEDNSALNHFNQSMIMYFPKDVTQVKLKQALLSIVERHDVFRLRFSKVKNVWSANYLPYSMVSQVINLKHIDLTNVSNKGAEKDFHKTMEEWCQHAQISLDIINGPLIQFVRFTTPEDEADRLFIVMHHLIVDGVSWRILKDDLELALKQQSENKEINLPQATANYHDWVNGLEQYSKSKDLLKEVEYWQSQLTKPGIIIETNQVVSVNTHANTAFVNLSWSKQLTEKLLNNANKCYATQINDLLLTALMLAVNEIKHTEDDTGLQAVQFDLEGHGREDDISGVNSSEILGWFTALYPVCLDPDNSVLKEDDDFILKQIISVKEQLKSIPDKGIGYGVLKYFTNNETINKLQSYSQISFNYLGQFDSNNNDKEEFLSWSQDARGSDVSLLRRRTHKISINGQVSNGCLQITFDYNNQMYHKNKIQRLANSYFSWLETIVEHCLTANKRYTPSDFPTVQLSISQLDELQNKYKLSDIYNSTDMQQGLLFETELSDDGGAYITQTQFVFENIDISKLKQAWNNIVKRHDIFRTAFVSGAHGKLFQLVESEVDLPWETLDWCQLDLTEHNSKLDKTLNIERHSTFDTASAPLMRLLLIEERNDKQRLIWTYHHALLDGWSINLILDELAYFYTAENDIDCYNNPLEVVPYKNYIQWLEQQNKQQTQSYWRSYLDKCEASHLPDTLCLDYQNENSSDNQNDIVVELSIEVSDRLKQLARLSSVTLNVVFQAAWGLLLSRYNDSSEVVFGVTHAGRPDDLVNSDRMIGLFINTLPVRMTIPNDNTLLVSWLQSLQKLQITQQSFVHAPLVEIQRWSELRSTEKLFDTLMVFQNTPDLVSTESNQLPLVDIVTKEEVHYPLSFTVFPGKQVVLNISYQSTKYNYKTIKQLTDRLEILITQMSGVENKNKNIIVNQLNLLTQKEKEKIINWTEVKYQPASKFVKNTPLNKLFEVQVQQTPNALALAYEGTYLTYNELNQKSNKLASYLINKGIRNKMLIGICLDRSIDIVVAILASLKIGSAYVPVDPDYPPQRLNYILKDSKVSCLITYENIFSRINKVPDKKNKIDSVLCLDDKEVKYKLSKCDTSNISNINVSENDIAYIIYTSGSTGLPKGVMVSNKACSIHCVDMAKQLALTPDDHYLHFASFCFDASVEQLFTPLVCGASSFVLKENRIDSEKMSEYLKENKITIADLPPAYLSMLLDDKSACKGLSLRHIIVGGEKMPLNLVKKWREIQISKYLVNCYGPTETTISASMYCFSQDDDTDRRNLDSKQIIGKAVAGRKLFVLSKSGQLQPVGVAGELCICGDAISAGYLNKKSLTDENFIENIYGNGKLYKTGDLVYQLACGNLVYLGRIDEQINIRGYRIEPAEIESLLIKHETVRDALVLAVEENSETRLVSYLLSSGEVESEISDSMLEILNNELNDELNSFLKEMLPEYMLPSSYVRLVKWPLTANGKIDINALPKVRSNLLNSNTVKPVTDIEKKLSELWELVLNIEHVGTHDNFFTLGGHSLLAAQLLVRIRNEFSVNIELKSIFKVSTISEQATMIDNLINNNDKKNISFTNNQIPLSHKNIPSGETIPLSYTQLLYWFIYISTKETANNGNPVLIQGELSTDKLNEAINYLIDHHDGIRACINDWNPVQKFKKTNDFSLTEVDFINTDDEKSELLNLVEQITSAPFNLETPPLLRGLLIRINDKKHILLIVFPHIVADGAALDIFNKHLESSYKALVNNTPLPLEENSIRLSDHVYWERMLNRKSYNNTRNFWKNALKDSGYPRFQNEHLEPIGKQKSRVIEITEEHLKHFNKICLKNKSTLQMTILTIVGIAIYLTTKQKKFSLTSVLENRDLEEMSNLIAPVFGLVMTPFNLITSNTFSEVLVKNKDHILNAYEYKYCPQSLLLSHLAKSRWLKTPKWYLSLLDFISKLLSKIYMKADLYPELVKEMLLEDKSPPEFSIKNIFKDKKTKKYESKIVRLPSVTVNILQGFYKTVTTDTKEKITAAGESSWKDTNIYDHISIENEVNAKQTEFELEESYQDGGIEIDISKSGRGTKYMQVSSRCLSNDGINDLERNLKIVMDYLIINPDFTINEVEHIEVDLESSDTKTNKVEEVASL
ncbi:MAG: amino acid adenylation domain-containing protein [Pseudomonadota bacterium]